MGCAKCHHHPFEKWSQDDYYGMAAFFSRMGTKNSQEFGIFGQRDGHLHPPGRRGDASAEERHGEADAARRRPEASRGTTSSTAARSSRDWLTAPANKMFARNMANRFWGYAMGRGLVEPLDDMRATNPATNPELLDALADDFVKAKFDLKHLLRTIFNSRAYQLVG